MYPIWLRTASVKRQQMQVPTRLRQWVRGRARNLTRGRAVVPTSTCSEAQAASRPPSGLRSGDGARELMRFFSWESVREARGRATHLTEPGRHWPQTHTDAHGPGVFRHRPVSTFQLRPHGLAEVPSSLTLSCPDLFLNEPLHFLFLG